jgi:hypothetical protein
VTWLLHPYGPKETPGCDSALLTQRFLTATGGYGRDASHDRQMLEGELGTVVEFLAA